MSPIIHALLIVTCTHALVALGTNNGESFSSLGIEPIGSINYTFDYNSTEPTCYHCENPFFTQMNSTSCSNADGLFSELDVKQFNDSIPPDYVLTEVRKLTYSGICIPCVVGYFCGLIKLGPIFPCRQTHYLRY